MKKIISKSFNKISFVKVLVAAFVLSSFFIFNSGVVLAASLGPNNTGTGADNTAVGTVTWSGTGNIISDNSSYATASVSSGGTVAATTHYLQGTNFGFAIPSGATINGIQVSINRFSSFNNSTNNAYDSAVRLIKGGTITGNNYAASGNWATTTSSVSNYGSTSDLWGISWTSTDINASNFGVVLSTLINRTSGNTVTASVDYIQVTVTYTPDITPPSGGSITYTNGYFTTASVPITYTTGSDSGSGLNSASGKIQRASATLSGGTCGTIGSFSDLVTESDGSYTDTSVVSGNCYKYQYLISDNAGNTATYTSANVAKVDTVKPILSEVTPVSSPTTDTTPDYTFNSTEAGSITYGGDCSSATTTAVVGHNTITFNTLSAGVHTNCTIKVTDAAGNQSSALNVSSFTVVTTGGLIVTKNTIGGNGTFSLSGNNGIGIFQITTTGNTGSQPFNSLTPNTYTITETVPSGWNKTSDTCTNINVTVGQTATCAITNTKLPILTVTKIVTNHAGGAKTVSDFPLFVNGNLVTSGVPTTAVIGQNVVTEISDANYAATFGGDCDSTGHITLVAGDNKSCTLTNEYIYGDNLIENPSFEQETGGLPLYWQEDSWSTNPDLTATFNYPVTGPNGAGDKAAQVTITQYGSDGDAKWGFNNVTVIPGKYYVFSDKYKSSTNSYVTVEYHPTTGGNSYEDIGTLSASDTWQTFSAGIIVPVNVNSLTIYHLIKGVGTLTTDDYSLIQTINPDAFSKGMVSLTFDDGWDSMYTNALPILNVANLKSTEYLITNMVQAERQGSYMTTSEVGTMYSEGNDIASHTQSHLSLTTPVPTAQQMQDEVFGSRDSDLLTRLSMKPVDNFAYPYGQYNDASKSAIIGAGYLGARTVDEGFNTKATDRYLLKVQLVERGGIDGTDIVPATTLDQVKEWIDTAALSDTWVILVFHQIDNNSANVYGITPEMLQNVVNYLKTRDVNVVTVSEGLRQMPGVPAAGDTVAPIITDHSGVVAEATSSSGVVVNYDVPTVSDNTDSNLIAACNPMSGSAFAMGDTTVTCTAADSSGNLTTKTFKVTVSKANQTITFNSLSEKTYGNADFDVSATASSSLPVSFTASNDYCTISGNTVHITGAGTCVITAHQAGDSMYNPAPDVSQSFTINKATPVITWNNPLDITYPVALSDVQLNATADVVGMFVYTPISGTVLSAGNGQNLHVDFTPTDTTNYNTASKDVTINVLKGAATIILDNLNQTYNGSVKSVSATTDPAGLTVDIVYTPENPTNAGDYSVTATINDSNYHGSITNTLHIDKATASVILGNLSQVYDANPKSVITTTDPVGLTVDFTYNGSSVSPTNAGTYAVIGTINNINYAGSASDSLVIDKAPLSITAQTNTKTYDGNANAIAVPKVSGLLGSDSATDLVEIYDNKNVGTDKTLIVSTYTIEDGNGGNNYNITTVPDTTGVITAANQDITFNALADKTYGDADFSVDAISSSGLTVSFSSLTPSVCTVSDSTIHIVTVGTCTIRASQAGNNNYNLAVDVDRSFEIQKAILTVTPDNKTKIYNTVFSDFTGTVSGVQYGDNIAATYASDGAIATATVGTYDIIASLIDSDSKLGNYSITLNTGILTVNAATLTITANNTSKTYGDTVIFNGTEFNVVGLASGDSVDSITLTSKGAVSTATVTSSPYDIVPTAAIGTGVDNYTINYVDGALTVNAKSITGSITVSNKTYDSTTTASITSRDLTGIVGTDDVSLMGGTADFDTKDVNTGKIVTATGLSLSGDDASNYILSSDIATTTADIKPKDLVVSATGIDKVYDGTTDATVNFLTDAISGDTVAVNGTASFEDSNVGSGKTVHATGISIDGIDATNYNLVNVATDTSANISLKPITITADNKTKSFGSPDPELTYIITSGSLVDSGDITGSLTRDAGENLGVYDIAQGTLAATSNYELTFVKGTLTIGDTVAPVFGPTPDITEEALAPIGNNISFNITATDDVDGSVTPTCVPPSESLFAIGKTSVNCTAIDSHGNTSSASFNVTVRDTTKPVISLNGDSAINLLIGDSYTDAGATALDNIDGDITSKIVVGGDTVNTSAAGVYHISYNVSDNAGNPADEVIRTVTVSDINAPVINPISDITVEAASSSGAIITYDSITATDDADGVISATCLPDSGSVFPLGTTTVTCSATDSSGNTGYGTGLKITVVDTTAPVIDAHDNVITEATSSAGAVVNYEPPLSHDIVDGDLAAECIPASGSTIPLGDTTVTCTKTDTHGNVATPTTFVITVQDTTAPVITLLGTNPVNIEVGSAYTDAGATASDNYDGDLTSSITTVNPVNKDVVGDYTVTYNVTDSHSNAAVEVTRTVHITTDATPPVITLNGDATITLNVGDSFIDPGTTATDNIDGNITSKIVVSGDTVNTLASGTYIIKYDVSDAAGNPAVQKTRTIIVKTSAPVITNETAASATTNSITVAWTTDHPATSRVIYDTVSHPTLGDAPNYDYAYSTVEDSTLATSHSVIVSGLSSGTTYYLRMISHGSPETVSNEISKTTSVVYNGGGGGGTSYTPIKKPGDINGDGKIDLIDFNLLMIHWGSIISNDIADLNADGKVDISEFNLLMVNWGK